MKESTRNTMKESLRNIRQIICRTTCLRSILVVLGVLISVSGWGTDWVGEDPVSGESYYIYNRLRDGFLNEQNGLSTSTTVTWTFSGSLENFTLTSSGGKVFAMYTTGMFGANKHVKTDIQQGSRTGDDIALRSDKTNGFYTIYRKVKGDFGGERNVCTNGLGNNCLSNQSEASAEWLFISIDEYNTKKDEATSNHVPFTIDRIAKFNALNPIRVMGNSEFRIHPDNSYDRGCIGYNIIQLGTNWATDDGDKIITLHFEGIPDKISFSTETSSPNATGIDFRVYEEDSNPVSWPVHTYKYTEGAENLTANPSDYRQHTIQLRPTTRYVRLYYTGNYRGYFENVSISELYKFDVSDDDIDFGDVSVNEGYPIQTITLDYANAGIHTRYIKASSSNPESFVVSPAQIECGRDEMGTQQYVITFVGKTEGSHSADITITDDDGNSKVVHVEGTRVLKKDPIFIWNQLSIPYYQGTTINDFVVSSNPKVNIVYSCSPNNAGVLIDDNGTLTIDNTASTPITITATQEGDNEWNEHEESRTINPINSTVPRVPFYLTENIFDNFKSGASGQVQWSGVSDDPYMGVKLGVDNAMGSTTLNYTHYVDIHFEGIPDSIFFRYRTNSQSADGNYKIFESSDGLEWSEIWKFELSWSLTDESKRNYSEGRAKFKQSTRYVRLQYFGSFGAYYKDLHISAYDGYGYLKKKDGEDFKYLSRGGNDGTNIISDEFGLAVRRVRDVLSASRSEITRAIFLDNKEIINPSTIANYPIFEKAKTYERELQEKKDKQAVQAASEFGIDDVPTEAILREILATEDYASEDIPIDNKPQHGEKFNDGGNSYVWQRTISGLQKGLYKITLKAFHRMCDKESAYEYYNNDEGHYDNSVAYFMVEYGNKLDDSYKCYKTPITTLFEVYNNKRYITSDSANYGMVDYEPISGHYYPDCANSAEVALLFADRYNNDIFIYVGENGYFVYSLYNPSNANHSNWLYWGDVTLTRYYRKEFVFDNGGDGHDGMWQNPNNWYFESPSKRLSEPPTLVHKVEINAPVTITDNGGAYSVTYGGGTNGNITIGADASLSVREGGFSDEYISENHITLKADNTGQTGALRMYPGTLAPKATVEMYSDIGTKEGLKNDRRSKDPWYWQYIGSPVTEQSLKNQNLFNERIFYLCWLFEHDTETNDWTNAGNWKYMEEFKGYAFTRDERSTGPLFGFSGTLNAAPKEPKEITLKYKDGTHCENFIANSWTAPIQIKNFKEEDFDKVSPNIYIYKKEDRGNVENVAIYTAEYTGNDVIPAMQGFSVKANAAGAKLVLDYNRLVWESEEKQNGALKAPSRVSGNREVDLSRRICVNMMSADSIADRVYLIEKEAEGFSPAFTEGYDAPKHEVTGLPCIYTYEPDGQHLNVSATDDLMGSYLALNTDSSRTYTISFSMVIGEGLGLRDLVADTILPIVNGGQYVFTAMPNSTNQLRFVVEEYVAPDNGNMGGTDITAADDGKISIVQQDEIVYITGAARNSSVEMYDAVGRSVLKKSFHYAATIDISALPAGIYVATVDKKVTIKVLR